MQAGRQTSFQVNLFLNMMADQHSQGSPSCTAAQTIQSSTPWEGVRGSVQGRCWGGCRLSEIFRSSWCGPKVFHWVQFYWHKTEYFTEQQSKHFKSYLKHCLVTVWHYNGGFLLTCQESGGKFDDSLPASAYFPSGDQLAHTNPTLQARVSQQWISELK